MRKREESIELIRRFNRRYVPAMGLLGRSYLDTGLSTLEAAALLEIYECEGISARDISRTLHMDKGYLSRAIKRFEEEGWVERSPAPDDARLLRLELTDAGREWALKLVEDGVHVVENAFDGADDMELAQVADAMGVVLGSLKQLASDK